MRSRGTNPSSNRVARMSSSEASAVRRTQRGQLVDVLVRRRHRHDDRWAGGPRPVTDLVDAGRQFWSQARQVGEREGVDHGNVGVTAGECLEARLVRTGERHVVDVDRG